MASKLNCVTIFGGSGFLGSAIVKRFSAAGLITRVATRHPEVNRSRKLSAQAGSVEAVYADVRDETSVGLAMEGCDAVINAVGLYVENGAETFEAVHEMGALNVAHQAATLGIDRLVHISGIGADRYSKSPYVRARGKGELLVMDVFSGGTVLRPSVLFGPSDKFLNTLAGIAKFSPILPLFGHGKTKLQPVYVEDVAEAALNSLGSSASMGKLYELGGPRIYTYRNLIELVFFQANRKRLLVPLPFAIWEMLARVASILPKPPMTSAQVALMKRDNIVDTVALSLADLGVNATSLEDILPEYVF